MSLVCMNEIDEMYVLQTERNPDGIFVCNVCGKEYKNFTSYEKHFNKKNCFSFLDLFKGTEREKDALFLYRSLLYTVNKRSMCNMQIFRKSPKYSQVIKVLLFCSVNEIFDVGLYVGWGMVKCKNNIHICLPFLCKDETYSKYINYLIKNQNEIDSNLFIEKNLNRLLEDDFYLLRSLQKCNMSLKSFFENDKLIFDQRIDSLPDGIKDEMCELVELVIKENGYEQ